MIEAAAFDLGGVLFAEGKSAAMDRMAGEYGCDKDAILKILLSARSIELRKGLIGDDEFWGWARGEMPAGCDPAVLKRVWYDSYRLDEDVRTLIEALKRRYRTIAFSGNIKSRVQFLDDRYGFRKLFDVEIYSFDYHRNKPDRRLAEVLIERAGCKADSIVYVDDNEADALPARRLGVHTLIYSTGRIGRLQQELRLLGMQW